MEINNQIELQIKEALELGKALDAKLVEVNNKLEEIKLFKKSNPGITFEDAKEKMLEYVEINQFAALYVQDINHISSILCTLYPLVKIGNIELGLSDEDTMLFEGIGGASKYIFKYESGEVKVIEQEIIEMFKEQTKGSLNEETLKTIFNKI